MFGGIIASMGQEFRYSLRLLARSPGFAFVTVLIFALGIGVNTAIFSILNALVIRELPVWQPEGLVQLSGLYRNGSKVPFSFPMFQELSHGQQVLPAYLGGAASPPSTWKLMGLYSRVMCAPSPLIIFPN